MFKQRMDLMKEVARKKSELGLQVEDVAREREVMERMCNLAGQSLEQYTRTLYSLIFELSRSYQERFINTSLK